MRLLTLLSTLLLTAACGVATSEPDDVAVHVGGVGLDPMTDSPVIVLEENDGPRLLPIWIGVAEARSIARQMEAFEAPRPNTHDLAKRLLVGLEATIDRVVVTKLREGTYYAVLVVADGSRRVEIDARPSDAIAIALRVQAPVYVRAPLFDSVDREESRPAERGPELSL